MPLFSCCDPQLEDLRDLITEEAKNVYKDVVEDYRCNRDSTHCMVLPSIGGPMIVMLKKIQGPEVKAYQAYLENYRGEKIVEGRVKGSKWDAFVSVRHAIDEHRKEDEEKARQE